MMHPCQITNTGLVTYAWLQWQTTNGVQSSMSPVIKKMAVISPCRTYR